MGHNCFILIRHNDENGILIMSLQEFLMDDGALEK